MIWIYLGVLVVLMSAPFVLSWHYSGKMKRTTLHVPQETSDIPFHHIVETKSEDVIRLDKLLAPARSTFSSPLFVEGKASFGKGSKLVSCHAKVVLLSEKSHIASYLEGDRYLSIGKECALEGRVECNGDMDIATNTLFFDLFARKIRFLGGASSVIPDMSALKKLGTALKSDEVAKNIRKVEEQAVVEKTVVTKHGFQVGKKAVIKGNVLTASKVQLSEGASIGGDMISKGSLTIGKNCYISGDISTEKDIKIEGGTIVFGNIISQKNITIGPGCHVRGNVFAQESIYINCDVTIGIEGQIKSVIAGDTINIQGKSTIYGRVRANRGGHVIKEKNLVKH